MKGGRAWWIIALVSVVAIVTVAGLIYLAIIFTREEKGRTQKGPHIPAIPHHAPSHFMGIRHLLVDVASIWSDQGKCHSPSPESFYAKD